MHHDARATEHGRCCDTDSVAGSCSCLGKRPLGLFFAVYSVNCSQSQLTDAPLRARIPLALEIRLDAAMEDRCWGQRSGWSSLLYYWYYWTDRTNNRHCWFLISKGAHVPSHGNVVSRPTPEHEQDAEQADGTPSQNYTAQTTAQIQINPSDDNLVTIATGNTFQQVIGSNGSAAERRALIIKNNNTNGDTCWVFFGDAKASKEESVVLPSGGSYVRYWPFVSSDALLATCASTSDTLYVEVK